MGMVFEDTRLEEGRVALGFAAKHIQSQQQILRHGEG
jgi:hypothetical protein